jgi:MFS transporter, NNP family, nitrate/nitrite transporter
VLVVSFIGTGALALLLPGTYKGMVPLTIGCLTMAVCLGLGTRAVFKLAPEWFPTQVGAVTGVVGAAGGLGGFFPPLVMATVKSQTGSDAVGFILMAAVAALALLVLVMIERPTAARAERHKHPVPG